jgi:hypothetical protein
MSILQNTNVVKNDDNNNGGGGVVKRIVLTGGPCGGKSTVQTLLSDVFSNIGWKGISSFFLFFSLYSEIFI